MNFNKHYNKNYFKIKLYQNSGRLQVEEVNETNFHPSQLNEIYQQVSEKDDFSFIIAEEKNVEKNTLKLIKYNLRKVEKELTFIKKQHEAYKKALEKIEQKVIVINE